MNPRRTSLMLCAVVFLLTGLVFGRDLPDIRNRGILRVIVANDEYPEMFSFVEGKPPGFERELLETFCRSQNVKLEVIAIDAFNKAMPMLQRNEGDVVTGIIDSPSRRREVDFTVEVFPVRHFVGTLATTPMVLTLPDLLNRNVGVVAGSSWEAVAREAGVTPSRLKSYRDVKEMMTALSTGNVTAVIMAGSDMTLAMIHNPDFLCGMPLGEHQHAGWAVSKQSPVLRQKLNEFLVAAKAANIWHKLLVKYYGERATEVLKRVRESER
jgi:ABC-type amino acid transport substrate-binding protein